jgi:hypothetical protein
MGVGVRRIHGGYGCLVRRGETECISGAYVISF